MSLAALVDWMYAVCCGVVKDKWEVQAYYGAYLNLRSCEGDDEYHKLL